MGQNKGLFSLETGDGGGHIFGALRGEEKQIKKKKNFRHLQLNVSLYKFKGPCVTHMTYNRNFCVSRLVKAFVNLLLKPSEECSLNENVKHKKKIKKMAENGVTVERKKATCSQSA